MERSRIMLLILTVHLLFSFKVQDSHAAVCDDFIGGECDVTAESVPEAIIQMEFLENMSSCKQMCETLGILESKAPEAVCCSYHRFSNKCIAVSNIASAAPKKHELIKSTTGTKAALCHRRGGQRAPHVVFVVVDDAGWNDVGWRSSNRFQTPYMEKLLSEGIALQYHYTMLFCAPSRFTIQTGRHPLRYGLQVSNVEQNFGIHLPLTEKIAPQYFKDYGYSTYGFGKWHLGHRSADVSPTYRGFDTWYGGLLGGSDHFTHKASSPECRKKGLDLWDCNNTEISPVWKEGGIHSTQLLTREFLETIERHNVEKSMYVYLAYNAPHTPAQAPEKSIKRFLANYPLSKWKNRATVAAMMEDVDSGMRQISDALDARGMREDTITVFLSDNGGSKCPDNQYTSFASRRNTMHSNFPLRGSKGTTWEGGIRTVAFVHTSTTIPPYPRAWKPIHASHRGTQYDGIFGLADWLPTLISVIPGSEVPFVDSEHRNIDGVSHWNVFSTSDEEQTAQRVPKPRDELVLIMASGAKALRWRRWKIETGRFTHGKGDQWYYPDYPSQQQTHDVRCRSYDRPLNKSQCVDRYCLFDIDDDPCERNEVSAEYPDVLRLMVDKLEAVRPLVARELSDDPVENCEGISIDGTWGFWRDPPIPDDVFEDYRMLDDIPGESVYTYPDVAAHADFILTRTTPNDCMAQCHDSAVCRGIFLWKSETRMVRCAGMKVVPGRKSPAECPFNSCRSYRATSRACGFPSEKCRFPKDCCSGLCQRNQGQTTGVCTTPAPTAAPTAFVCKKVDQSCQWGRDCCSGRCGGLVGSRTCRIPCAEVEQNCTDNSDCCSWNCVGKPGAKVCDVTREPTTASPTAPPTCRDVGEKCKWQSQCCSGKCRKSADSDVGECMSAAPTPAPSACMPVDMECTWASDCCTGRCSGMPGAKTCKNPCGKLEETCDTHAECCSGFCRDNDGIRTCALPPTPAPTACMPSGHPCKYQSDCCSARCTGQEGAKTCAPPKEESVCNAIGASCRWMNDCCSNQCSGRDSVTKIGTCAPNCTASALPCRWQRECCSGLCVQRDKETRIGVCKPVKDLEMVLTTTAAPTPVVTQEKDDICLVSREVCLWASQCCSGRCAGPKIGIRMCKDQQPATLDLPHGEKSTPDLTKSVVPDTTAAPEEKTTAMADTTSVSFKTTDVKPDTGTTAAIKTTAVADTTSVPFKTTDAKLEPTTAPDDQSTAVPTADTVSEPSTISTVLEEPTCAPPTASCKKQRDCCSKRCRANASNPITGRSCIAIPPCRKGGRPCTKQKQCCSNRCAPDDDSPTGRSCKFEKTATTEPLSTPPVTTRPTTTATETPFSEYIDDTEDLEDESGDDEDTVADSRQLQPSCQPYRWPCALKSDCCSTRCGFNSSSPTGKSCRLPKY
eukprot:m.1114057 g.1114057  ORF g.1114057 m.1114057 type:complete len:1404 (-) comp24364_c0_seq10:195-4406(-)